MCSKPVTEQEHLIDLCTSNREHVEVDVRVRAFEDPMLEPVWLANPEHIACHLHVGHVRRFVRRVWHSKDHIDDRLCRKIGYGCRSRMFEQFHTNAKDG